MRKLIQPYINSILHSPKKYFFFIHFHHFLLSRFIQSCGSENVNIYTFFLFDINKELENQVKINFVRLKGEKNNSFLQALASFDGAICQKNKKLESN